MTENDIAVELSALSNAQYKIGRQISELERFASQLKRNMSIAGREFDSANFARASEVIDSVLRKLGDANDRMQKVKAYLDKVEDRAENYLRCKFGG